MEGTARQRGALSEPYTKYMEWKRSVAVHVSLNLLSLLSHPRMAECICNFPKFCFQLLDEWDGLNSNNSDLDDDITVLVSLEQRNSLMDKRMVRAHYVSS